MFLERQRARRGGLGFGAEDADFRSDLPDGAADSRDQSAAADGSDHGLDSRQIFEDLDTEGCVAGDEVVVVKRMDECSFDARKLADIHRMPAGIEGCLHDSGAEVAHALEFGFGRGVDRHDCARDAGFARRECDTLSRVAGADRPNAFLPRFG